MTLHPNMTLHRTIDTCWVEPLWNGEKSSGGARDNNDIWGMENWGDS